MSNNIDMYFPILLHHDSATLHKIQAAEDSVHEYMQPGRVQLEVLTNSQEQYFLPNSHLTQYDQHTESRGAHAHDGLPLRPLHVLVPTISLHGASTHKVSRTVHRCILSPMACGGQRL